MLSVAVFVVSLTLYCGCQKQQETLIKKDESTSVEIPTLTGTSNGKDIGIRFLNDDPVIEVTMSDTVRFYVVLKLPDEPNGLTISMLILTIKGHSGVVMQSAVLRPDADLTKGENRFESTGPTKIPKSTGTFDGVLTLNNGEQIGTIKVVITK